MNTTLIQSSEYEALKISSLPTSPTADVNYGGYGYSASEMKAAFDALPLFILAKLNTLITDILAEPNESVAASMKTGISDSHTLSKLFEDVKDGSFASYLDVGGESLLEALVSIKNELNAIKAKL